VDGYFGDTGASFAIPPERKPAAEAVRVRAQKKADRR